MFPPKSKVELMQRAQSLSGHTLSNLAQRINIEVPVDSVKAKGWVGQTLETLLGATAGSLPIPDFPNLSVELKTLPIGDNGKPCESTFVTAIPLLTVGQETWKTSTVYKKLKCVLWMPYEASKSIPFAQRRLGFPILWSPSSHQERILEQDWNELTEKIVHGELDDISSKLGKYLQVRPKAANGRTLCDSYDSQGVRRLSLPRGFYLRTVFTQQLFYE